MKRLLSIIVSILLLSPQTVVFAQGSGCETCSAAPPELQKYITTMVKLIDLIPLNKAPEDPRFGTGTTPFKAGIASKKAQALQIYTTVLSPTEHLGNFFSDIDLILDGSVRARDAIALRSIDEMLADRVIQAYAQGTLTDYITDDVYQKIDQTFQELGYVSLAKKRSGGYTMEGKSAQYYNYAALLWSYNKIYKTLHNENRIEYYLAEMNSGYDVIHADKPSDAKEHPQKENLGLATKYVDQLTDYYLSSLTDGRTGDDVDWLKFSNNQREFFLSIWSIHDDYVCATGIISSCDESRGSRKQTAQESRGHVKDTRKTGGGTAINTFKRSWADLRDSFRKGSDRDKEGWTQRENFLLHSMYGKDIPAKMKRRGNPGGPGLPFAIDAHVDPMPMGVQAMKTVLLQGAKYAGVKLGRTKPNPKESGSSEQDQNQRVTGQDNENLADSKAKRAGIFDKYTAYLKETKDNAWTTDDKYSGILQAYTRQKERVASFQQTYDSVIALQYEFETQSVLVDTNVVTKRMPLLSAVVHKNMADLGGKNDRGMIYNSMAQVCEIQCANKGGKCWYDGD